MGIRLQVSRSESQLSNDLFELKEVGVVDPILHLPLDVTIPLRDLDPESKDGHLKPTSKLLTLGAGLRVVYTKDHVDISLVPPDGVKYHSLLFSKLENISGERTLANIADVAFDFMFDEPSTEWSPSVSEKPKAKNEKQGFEASEAQVALGGKEKEEDAYSGLKFSSKIQIGNGSFADVFQVTSKTDGLDYALKVVENGNEDARREARCLAHLKHKNIVSYVFSWIDRKSRLCICMELCSSTLAAWLRLHRARLIEDKECREALAIFRQLVDAVSYFHSRGIIHQDLSPSNIFMAMGESNVPKIGDFGIASMLEDGQSTIPWRDMGQAKYRAPEMVHGKKPVSNKIDIFSLGLIFFELLYPHTSSEEREDIFNKIRIGKLPSCVLHMEQGGHDLLLAAMLSVDLDVRPTAEAILIQLDKMENGQKRRRS